MRTGEGVWPRVMKRENMGLGEEGRTGSVMAEKHWRRERKWEKRRKWPSNGNKLGPTKKLSPDLNLAWIKK